LTDRRPGWLPQLINCSGDWHKTLAGLYAVFTRDFTQGQPRFRGRRVWWDRRKDSDGYEEGFWHLISRSDAQAGDRIPDYRRAERLCWCRPLIEHADEPEVKVWSADQKGRVREYLWLPEEDYVVVLDRRGGEVSFLVTAYCLDGDSSRRKLRRSYENRLL
jgi:hypothetical protein